MSGRSGFAVALVVLMLFAIAVAGITGYQVISAELVMSTQTRDGHAALAVARGGLQRFIGEQVGELGDSVSYAIGNGIAMVTTREVLVKDASNRLYFIRSTGTVADARTPLNPARRAVGAYAWLHVSPIPLKAGLWVSGGTVHLSGHGYHGLRADVSGFDHATAGECAGGGSTDVAGIVYGGHVVSSGATLEGDPNAVPYSGFSAMYDTVGIRWDILTSPNFPVDFEDAMPDFGSLPADSFPVIRFNHGLTQHFTHGRGVLIVNGTFVPGFQFTWDGIILAGQLDDVTLAEPTIRGMLIAGMSGSNPTVQIRSGQYYFHFCNASAADRALSYLELVDNSIFEING